MKQLPVLIIKLQVFSLVVQTSLPLSMNCNSLHQFTAKCLHYNYSIKVFLVLIYIPLFQSMLLHVVQKTSKSCYSTHMYKIIVQPTVLLHEIAEKFSLSYFLGMLVHSSSTSSVNCFLFLPVNNCFWSHSADLPDSSACLCACANAIAISSHSWCLRVLFLFILISKLPYVYTKPSLKFLCYLH